MRGVDCMFSSAVNRGRGRLRRTLEEVVKRDLIVNKIFEVLFFNRVKCVLFQKFLVCDHVTVA